MSAPTSRDPLVVNTKDGVVWQRRAVTADGRGLYAVTGSCSCPEFLMATLAELAEHGIVGSADVLPMPAGVHVPPWPPAPRDFEEKLRQDVARLQGLLAEAVNAKHLADRERDLMRERVSEPFGCKYCGAEKRWHGRRSMSGAGVHGWERPSDEQVKARMLARRAARLALDVAHDAGRRDRYAKALYEFVNGAFVWEACDDPASWLEEADAAIVVADAEQAEWRDRVDEVERKYIVDTAELKRRPDALNAAHGAGMPVGIDLDGTLTDHNAWSVVWDRTAERWTVAGYEDAPPVEESADRLTEVFAPVAALREDDDVRPQVAKLRALLAGQREARDLPETGGA